MTGSISAVGRYGVAARGTRSHRRGLLDYLLPPMLVGVGLLTVVVPNSFKAVAGASIVIVALLALVNAGGSIMRNPVFRYAAAMGLVTVLYILVGAMNGAPQEAINQVSLIYLLFPAFWCVICVYIVSRYPAETLVRWFIAFLLLSAISIAYYFWAFNTLGAYAVEFLVENPNVDIREEGYVAAIMYVYGSLIFMVAGLLASPTVIKSLPLRLVTILIAAVSAFTSGRSALILAVGVGVLVGMGHNLAGRGGRLNFNILARALFFLVFVLGLMAMVILLFRALLGIDLLLSIDILFEKLMSRGGAGRSEQSYALIDGIAANWGLGSGHGIAVGYIVDMNYPWRYEMIWLASAFRVGIFGSAIYALPFVIVLVSGGSRLIRGSLSPAERFLYAGFFCSFLTSNTNPYIEGFVFQWMFILPLAYFMAPEWQRGRQA
jgi:hypothetical protein